MYSITGQGAWDYCTKRISCAAEQHKMVEGCNKGDVLELPDVPAGVESQSGVSTTASAIFCLRHVWSQETVTRLCHP